MTLQTVKLSQLRLSPMNVRRVKPKAIEQLAADMWRTASCKTLSFTPKATASRLCVFTDAQKAEDAIVLFVGHSGEIEAKAIRTKRVAKEGDGGAPVIKPDYSGAMIEMLSKIKTLAVQEAVATNPALALDILLDCLVGQGKAAADNCAKLKKDDLAAAAAERMAGRGWRPPALVIAEPPLEVVQERAAFDDKDEVDENDEAAEVEDEHAG